MLSLFFIHLVCAETSGGQINATRMTAIAAREDFSDTIEVRARIHPNQTWRFKCDLFINGQQWYVNFTEEKLQFFRSNHFFNFKKEFRLFIY